MRAGDTIKKPDRRRGLALSWQGAGVLGLGLLLGLAGINSGTNLIYLLSATLFAVVLVDWALSGVALRHLTGRRSHPGHVFAGEEMKVDLVIKNRKRWFGAASVRVREDHPGPAAGGWIFEIRPGGRAGITYPITLPRRGRHRFEALEVSTLYPFGFLERRRRLAVPSEVIVLPEIRRFQPRPGQIPAAGRVARRRSWVSSDEEEFHGVREYRDGDNPRRIHWKTTARKGTLMVKDLRALQSGRLVVVLDSSVPEGSDPSRAEDLERAIILAASILHDGYRRNRAMSLLTHAPGLVEFPGDRGRTHLFRMLESLGCLEPPGEEHSAALVRQARARVSDDDEVWFLSLGGGRGAPAGGNWCTLDLSRGDDKDLLGKERVDVFSTGL